MNRTLFILLSTCLISCSEGVSLSPEEVDDWRVKNKQKIEEIVLIFRNDPCLDRVELGSMRFIDQNCKVTPKLSENISKIQKLLSALEVVLAAGYRSKDGNFNVSILLNRKGIAVSGGGLSLEYWERLESPWTKLIECGEMEQLSEKHWYIHKLQDGPSCY